MTETETATGAPRSARGRFRNPWPDREPGFGDFLRWQWERRRYPAPDPGVALPTAANDPRFLQANRERTTLTWIGHATVLLQLAGCNLLTDPVFSRRAFPVQWSGPKRLVPPGLALAELPVIDLVLLSHDHYDALDASAVRSLRRLPGGENTVFAVPLGFARWLRRRGIEQVRELDWWEEAEVAGLHLTLVPSRHWGKRSLLDTNRRLWGGWVVRRGNFRFFFAGDSGYDPDLFRAIGERLGPFDLAALPIGAYSPRWFMRTRHMTPEEAAMAHRDLRARCSVAIHWGTFILTDEPVDEPPRRLGQARQEHGIAEEEFRVLQHGETILL